MAGTTVQIGANADFRGYLSLPPGGRGPGLLVFHAIFGVNEVIRAVADDFAQQGYVALCPDLFWRQQRGVDLREDNPQDMQRGIQLFGAYDSVAGIEDLESSLRELRNHLSCTGRVGCVGYCFGGRMAYLMASHTDVDAAVSYYGTAIDRHLDAAARVNRPLVLHFAGQDKYIPPDAVVAIRAALASNLETSIYEYPKANHAFARIGSEHYDEESALLANQRTAAFLNAHLR